VFVDEQRERFGVEPICRTLGVSASAYYQRATGKRSTRSLEDERLLERIREIHSANYFAYGSWRMWKALERAGEQVGRGRVERCEPGRSPPGGYRPAGWRATNPPVEAMPLDQREPPEESATVSKRLPSTTMKAWPELA